MALEDGLGLRRGGEALARDGEALADIDLGVDDDDDDGIDGGGWGRPDGRDEFSSSSSYTLLPLSRIFPS